MNFLARLFTAGLPAERNEFAEAATQRLRRLLAEIANSAAPEAARVLLENIHALVSAEGNPARRLALLDTLRGAAERLLPTLEDEIEASPLPLAQERVRAALAADNLMKALAGDYQKLLAALATVPSGRDEIVLKKSAQHAARLLLRRQFLACRAGKKPSVNGWRHLHRVYRLARDRGFAGFDDDGCSIESCYLSAVLLTLTDPARTPRTEVPALLAAIRRLAPLARLLDATPADGKSSGQLLVINPSDQRPALRRGKGHAGGAAWRIDLDPVTARVQDDIRAAERRRDDADRDPQETPIRLLVRLLESLRRQPVRRFTRQCIRPRVNMIIGMDNLWWALSGPTVSRRRPTGTLMPKQDDLEWIIVDEGPDGFGLRLERGGRPQVDVGDIVGVGLRDVGRMLLCIVRRIDDDQRLRCRVGVQQLAPDAEAIVLFGQGPTLQERVICLSSMPAHGGRPGLVAPVGRLKPGSLAHEVEGDYRTTVWVGAAVESNGRHALHLVDAAPQQQPASP